MISGKPSLIPVELLLKAYLNSFFPMATNRSIYHPEHIEWVLPKLRGIFPMDKFHVSGNTQRWIRNNPHTVTINKAFLDVIKGCGNRDETWISPVIIDSYLNLHQNGLAHSVEVWIDEELVGGLYGVSFCGCFFGESMFQTKKDMAKIALFYCHKRLEERRFILWDTQFYTEHLGTMGCHTLLPKQYRNLLEQGLKINTYFDEVEEPIYAKYLEWIAKLDFLKNN